MISQAYFHPLRRKLGFKRLKLIVKEKGKAIPVTDHGGP
jgi:hypothetical protein